MKDLAAAPSPTAPFRRRAFAILWLATVASNVGTWMHDVGAGWLMTELSPSPFMVAAVQAATTLPVFMFALLAGAVADIIDKRKLLIWVNAGMGGAALILALVVHAGLMTPWMLLIFTFLFGAGAAFIAPAWQAIVPKLVPREELSAAVALNSMGINVSRAIGPALAGFLIVAAGLAAPFLVNAISFLGVIAALIWWRPPAASSSNLPAERIGGAMIAGLRYAWNSPELKSALRRAAAFFIFVSAFWAMLPLVARASLEGDATLYGVLLAAVGAGAVGGAFLLPAAKKRLNPDRMVAAGTVGAAASMIGIGLTGSMTVAVLSAAIAGVSWIAVLSTLNVAAQNALPDWVRARGLSIFLTVFFGSMSLGSLFWGQVADLYSIEAALVAAAIGALLLIPITLKSKLGGGGSLAPSMHWPDLLLDADAAPDGPVQIMIEYEVAHGKEAEFANLMNKLAASRRRGGGRRWLCMQSVERAGVFTESWLEESWLDHQRHHQRVTEADAALQAEIAGLLAEGKPPTVRHLLSMNLSDRR